RSQFGRNRGPPSAQNRVYGRAGVDGQPDLTANLTDILSEVILVPAPITVGASAAAKLSRGVRIERDAEVGDRQGSRDTPRAKPKARFPSFMLKCSTARCSSAWRNPVQVGILLQSGASEE